MVSGRFIRRILAIAALVCCGVALADVGPRVWTVKVRVADDCEGMGAVSGGGRSLWSGGKTTIKATAKKGNAFAGWYLDGDRVSREASYTFYPSGSESVYEARFLAAKDDWLRVTGVDADFYVGESLDGYGNLEKYFSVDSGSSPTIRISGLPSGVKYDAKSQTLSGAPTKRGVYYVTCAVQNGNGYKHTGIAVWNVGDASNGDYDNIGLDGWFDVEELGSLKTGKPVDLCTNLKSITGLPAGLKFVGQKCNSSGECTECGGFISGTPTKPGAFKVTFTDYSQSKAVKTLVVADGGSAYLEIDVGAGYEGRGSVSGAGVYTAGTSVKLSAKPASRCYFAGWYEDSDCETPFSELADWRKASASFVFRSDEMDDLRLYARFVSKGEDSITIDGDDTWTVEDYSSYSYEVKSETLPTDTVKGLPSGIKWAKDGRYFYVSDRMKLKPGTTVATITTKNLTGQTATKNVRIVVPNLQSWVFDGLEYSDSAYNLTVGVSDLCVFHWFGFQYDEDYKISVSGLPPGLKLEIGDGNAYVRGTPTKTGVYTVTLTAKSGRLSEKATFTINVNPLPEFAVGTFNGILRDKDTGVVVGSFTFTAAENGKQSVKVVTEMGTMSLSEPAWNCYDDDGIPMADFYKYSKNERFWLMMTPADGAAWNCEHQLNGTLSWKRSSTGGESEIEAEIDFAQRNPFAKTGSTYDHPSAADVAESLALEYKSMKMVILWDSDSDAYYLECANCVVPEDDYGTATLKMNKKGTATLSGKLYGIYNFSATATLVFDTACGVFDTGIYGEHCHAVFTPTVKMKRCTYSLSSSKCYTENEFVTILWRPLD